jgi:predicted N-acetyltransferase YhbS
MNHVVTAPAFLIRDEAQADIAAREALLDLAFGATRFAKTSERLREGRLPAAGLSFAADGPDGRLIGTLRLWHVTAGPGRPALLLGPLAVHPWFRGHGLGAALMAGAINAAAQQGHRAILLVGDAPYYARFGFTRALTRGLWLPGPVDGDRFLGLALQPGALDGAAGFVQATGDVEPLPDLPALVARHVQAERRVA